MRRASPEQMEETCNRFNALHKVGDEVRYWPGAREGQGKVGGYTIDVSGPAPAKIMMLPKGGE